MPTDYPAKPHDLTGDAAKVWHTLRLAFRENGTPVRTTDTFALADLCRVIARVQQLEREMGNNFAVPAENSTTKNTVERKNPRYQMLREYRLQMWKSFEKLGMDPVDAQRLPLVRKGKTARERLFEGFESSDLPGPHKQSS